MKTIPHKTQATPLNGNTYPKDGNPIGICKNFASYSVVALSQQNKNQSIALLTFSVGEINQESSVRVQLLPDGVFKTKDGRPGDVASGYWLMDETAFGMLKVNASGRENDFMFDYEHQTLNSDTNGKAAPAAGWFNKLEYVPGEGLFALDVDWTTVAAKYINEKEYRYVSAVFSYDKKTGRPIELRHAALTNEPAIDGMKALVALKSTSINSTTKPTGEDPMNEAFKLLLDLLGVSHDGIDLADAVALKGLQNKAKEALVALKSNADKSGQLQTDLDAALTSVAALKADTDKTVNLSQFVPKATYDAAVTQLATLKAETQTDSVEQLLKDNADKVFEAETQYLTDFGKQQGVAALKEMLTNRPAIAALKTTQTKGKKKPDDNGGNELNNEQIAMCKNIGLDQNEFKAQLQKEGGEQ